VRQPGRWLPWAVGLQVALIAAVGALLVDTDHRALVYRTLGATEVAPQRTGSIAVVFDPRTTEDEIRRIVRAAGARIVDGPTTTDAYVLDAPGGTGVALQTLRSNSAVVLAEPLQSGR